jgi:hypothetical protein
MRTPATLIVLSDSGEEFRCKCLRSWVCRNHALLVEADVGRSTIFGFVTRMSARLRHDPQMLVIYTCLHISEHGWTLDLGPWSQCTSGWSKNYLETPGRQMKPVLYAA